MENFNYYQQNLSLHLLRNFFLEHGKQHTYRKKDFLSASMKFHGLPGGLCPVALSIRLQTKKALNIL